MLLYMTKVIPVVVVLNSDKCYDVCMLYILYECKYKVLMFLLCICMSNLYILFSRKVLILHQNLIIFLILAPGSNKNTASAHFITLYTITLLSLLWVVVSKVLE